MAADGAGRRARRVEQHRVERSGLPLGRVGGDGFGRQLQAGEILPQPFEALGRAVDRGHAGAGGGKLRGLAAGRGAQIGDAQAAHVAEQPRRQRGGGVLHPPRAFVVAGERRDRAVHDRAHRSGRQHAPAERLRPLLGLALDRQVERRLPAVGVRDGAGRGFAVARSPARHQPAGRVEHRRIGCGQALRALARDPAEHRVDQSGIARRTPVGLRQPHREIDRGVVGHFEPEDLRGADQQGGLDPRRIGRQPAFEQQPEQMAQRPEPAQHRRDEAADQRAVALGERRKAARRGRRAARRAYGAGAARLRECRPRSAARSRPGDSAAIGEREAMRVMWHESAARTRPATSRRVPLRGRGCVATARRKRPGSRAKCRVTVRARACVTAARAGLTAVGIAP